MILDLLRLLFPALFPSLTEQHRRLIKQAGALRDAAHQRKLAIAAAIQVLGVQAAEAFDIERKADAMTFEAN